LLSPVLGSRYGGKKRDSPEPMELSPDPWRPPSIAVSKQSPKGHRQGRRCLHTRRRDAPCV